MASQKPTGLAPARQTFSTVVEDGPIIKTGPQAGAPVLSQTQAEIEAGRQRVEEHKGRQKLIDAKRANEGDEGSAVRYATEQNKDL
jgi:hypothetical protein